MTLTEFERTSVSPALQLLPSDMDSKIARILMMTFAQQESQLAYRRQLNNGPARSFYQFEKGSKLFGGGVYGVMTHKASRYWLNKLCEERNVTFDNVKIWEAIEFDDVLASGLARLLIFTDPYRLPQIDDVDGAWAMYAKRLWKPGKPHPETFPEYYRRAKNYVLQIAS